MCRATREACEENRLGYPCYMPCPTHPNESEPWALDDAIAAAEIARGDVKTFNNAADAIAWLEADDTQETT